jgi:hypothetical protein
LKSLAARTSAFKIKDGGVYCIEEISTAPPDRMPAPN